MKQKTTIYALLAVLLVLASCKKDENTSYTLYGDAAITDFSLGTLNRYINGKKTTYAGSTYTMQIDAMPSLDAATGKYYRNIYNVDSLPMYTDTTHVICSITALNNGFIALKNMANNDYVAYNSTDSVNFGLNRIFGIWATDGSGYNDYKVELRMHRQDGNVFEWNKMTGMSIPADPTLPAGIQQLLGKTTYEEYAVSTGGKIMKKGLDETTWTQDLADDHADIANLPTSDMALAGYALPLADSTDCAVLVGTLSGKTVVWRKIVDNTGKKAKGNWVFMERGSETSKLLPALTNLSLIRYGTDLVALGGDYSAFYKSRDNGITWEKTKYLTIPSGLDKSATKIKMVVDANNYIWLYCYGTGEVWRTRQNKFGWAVQ